MLPIMVALIDLPPENTNWEPPLLTVVRLATPPSSSSTPPLLTVVPMAVPPETTSRKPLLRTTTPLLVWPAEMVSD